MFRTSRVRKQTPRSAAPACTAAQFQARVGQCNFRMKSIARRPPKRLLGRSTSSIKRGKKLLGRPVSANS